MVRRKEQARSVVDAVVIGRNEGERLGRCLASLSGEVRRVVYVDSGSTDGSVALARNAGAQVVCLDMAQPFTAARARNTGFAALGDDGSPPDYVQFVDGDCEVVPGWIRTASTWLDSHPDAVVACGRRRERKPGQSVYNWLCDREWNTAVGEALACGGDALMRYTAVAAAGGYRESLIAGEEPELCLRLRRAGGRIWRLDAEMTLHDAAITRFGQWWKRTRRAGHAYAEGAALHGNGPERHWRRETRRALLWGLFLPAGVVLAGAIWPVAWLLALIWPLQVVRLAWRDGPRGADSWRWAFFTVLGKFAEAQGAAGYWLTRWRGGQNRLIEYK